MASVAGSSPPWPPRLGGSVPKKPWEQAGTSSGPTPFNPPSTGSTSQVVEASRTARPGEVVSGTDGNGVLNRNPVGRPVPSRPWASSYANNVGGYGSSTAYGSGMYGPHGHRSYGGMYGGSGMYGGGMYGEGMHGGGMYGRGMYGGGYGGQFGSYGLGMNGPYGNQDPNNPNNPFGAPASPPGFWMSLMRVLFDRSGMIYGELARFVLRILGIRTEPRKAVQGQVGPVGGLPGPVGTFSDRGAKS